MFEVKPLVVETDVVKVRMNDAFDPRKVAAYRKEFNGRFKAVPKPSRLQRVLNFFKRYFA